MWARDGSGLRKLSDDEAKLAPPAAGDSTRDKKRTVYSRDGDIFLYDAADGTTRQITKTDDAETNPHFTHDEKRVAFTRGNNLYVIAIWIRGATEQMTDIRPAGTPPPPDEEKGTASQEALKKDQKDLFDVIRERAAEREEQEAKRKRENPRKPFILAGRANRRLARSSRPTKNT